MLFQSVSDLALERMATGPEKKEHATVKFSIETGILPIKCVCACVCVRACVPVLCVCVPT